MFKFKYKKHVREDKDSGKVIVYYNMTDIFLGVVLLWLVFFYVSYYLNHVNIPEAETTSSITDQVSGQLEVKLPKKN